MRRLTDDELREPDVTLIIPYSKAAMVPREVWETLKYFIGKDTGKAYIFTVPAYRAREFLEYGRRLTDKAENHVPSPTPLRR